MRYTEISRQDWKGFFDVIAGLMTGKNVELEVAGLDVGDQIEIEWTSLDSLSYDPRQDRITLETQNESHGIDRPTEIIAIEDDVFLRMLTVRDCVGRIQIIRFRDPMMLMPPLTLVS